MTSMSEMGLAWYAFDSYLEENIENFAKLLYKVENYITSEASRVIEFIS